jgi:UDP-2,3-diacylglucosamine pyrophosphatase LpxH
MERKLRKTNVRFRDSFPEKESREFALRMFASGVDFVVLGHFHTERLVRFAPGQGSRVLVVLPSWKEEWRYFYLTAEGEYGFRHFRPDAPLL